MIKEKRTASRMGWLTVILMCLGVFVPSYAQYQFTALGARFIELTGITEVQYSSIITAPQAPGIFFSLIAGVLVDRFGVKKVLTVGFFLTAAGAVARIWSYTYPSMFICMFLIGINATLLNTNGPKIIGYWFEKRKINLIMGIFTAVINGSLAVGAGTGALFPEIKTAFAVSGLIACLASVLWVVFYNEKKAPMLKREELSAESNSPPVLECLRVVLKSPAVWMTGLALALLFIGSAVMSLFLPVALVRDRGVAETAAGAVSMSMMLGAMISCYVTPLIDMKLGKTRLLMFVYGIIGALGAAFAWRAPRGFIMIVMLFITGFVTTGLSPLLMSIPVKLKEIGTKYAGTAGGVAGTIQLAGSVVVPTYILKPIAGDNNIVLFYLFAASLTLFAAVSLLLPLGGRGKQASG
ncbi:MAG: MFS transporter [Clostridiales bacterium]|nr:MFS transporter [Clostridiales bacterium]